MKMTIDPGLSGTGYCIWNDDFSILKKAKVLSPSGTIAEKKAILTTKLVKSCKLWKVDTAYIEYPAKFGGAKGNMVANKGDLVKLSVLIGYIQSGLVLSDVTCVEVPVIKWKGQLPKKIINKRIRRMAPVQDIAKLSPTESHDWDAYGIALYERGDL